MDDQLAPDDPLFTVAASLQADVPVRDGLPARIRRRGRQQRRRRIAATVLTLGLIALAVEPRLDGRQQVTFALQRPSSHRIALVGDFTDWRTDRLVLTPTRSGGWEVTLRLRPGRYRFAYVADNGEWIPDDNAPPVLDDFGRPTSVITVLKP
jgi:1,4-alpha-glucan branching enzyme